MKPHTPTLNDMQWTFHPLDGHSAITLGLLQFMSLIHTCLPWQSEVSYEYSHKKRPFSKFQQMATQEASSKFYRQVH